MFVSHNIEINYCIQKAEIIYSLLFVQERRAIVVLKGDIVSGNVTFVQAEEGGPVVLSGTVSGLTKGKHGFHIHEKGDISGGCKTTEAHFNPDKVIIKIKIFCHNFYN